VKVSSPSEVSDYGREPCSDVANAVDGGGETASFSRDSAGEHVSVSGLQWKKFAMVQNTSRYRVCFRKPAKVARQAFDESCPEADRIKVIEPTARRKRHVTQVPGFTFDHRFSWQCEAP
jgi:hypothetical protein